MSDDAIERWQEKLAFLERELVQVSSADQKFQLRKQIDECRTNIARLGGSLPRPPHRDPQPAPMELGKEASDQFRERVREFLSDHNPLSQAQTISLELFAKRLGLSQSEADRIVAEEEAPLQRARHEYAEMLKRLIQAWEYPFDAHTEQVLAKLRQELNLTDSDGKRIAQPLLKPAKYFREDLGNGVLLKLVRIPGGRFLMGSPDSEVDRRKTEGPQHPVTVQEFYLGIYPVTQAQWRAVAALPQVKIVLDPDPSHFKGDNRPVERVSWDEAVEFCDRISVKTGRTYRLPSEAEWEYACRAGTTTRYSFGDDPAQLGAYAWYDANSSRTTHPVGEKEPNAWGLFDMHGNVLEWCLDSWHDSYEGAPRDGSVWLDKNDNHSRKLLRGGLWGDSPRDCRSAYRINDTRGNRYFIIGFRVCCVPPRLSS